MSFTLKVRSSTSPSSNAQQFLKEDSPAQATLKNSIEITDNRDFSQDFQSIDVNNDDALCLEFSDGFQWWMQADEAAKIFAVDQSRDHVDGDIIEIDPAQALAKLSRQGRSITNVTLKALKVVGIDLAGKTARSIATWFEDKALHKDGPGIYRVDPSADQMSLNKVDSLPALTGPILIFIHGTASSSTGSFSELWASDNDAGRKLREYIAGRYPDRVFALEHRTLTESPIENALALIKQLPKEAEAHLITHSRGGLIGDLLCLPPDQCDKDILDRLFEKDRSSLESVGFALGQENDYSEQRKKLDDFLECLKKKTPTIKAYVRTACPALGTTLASGKLDRWLSVLRHIANQCYSPGIPIIADEILSVLFAIIKERTDPRSLPGLESMMPGSALVRLLNAPILTTNTPLTVISGDAKGETLWGRLKLSLPDWFFEGDHDFVVNTESMYGGLHRTSPASYFFDQGPDVCHFTYFKNPKTVIQIANALRIAPDIPSSFRPIKEEQKLEPARALTVQPKPAGSAPIAIVLPGILGSELSQNGTSIWLDFGRLFCGEIDRLAIGKENVTVGSVLKRYYGEFISFLQHDYRVDVFAYDWRQSVLDSAHQLKTLVETRLAEAEQHRQPLYIIAHSMGGMVARAMLGLYPELWQRLKNLPSPSMFRLLMLGTPNHGSYQALRLLSGQHQTTKQLAWLDITHSHQEILDLIKVYPGVAELLPWGDSQRPLGVSDYYGLPGAEALKKARSTWDVLKEAPADEHHMSYVAGYSGETPTACQRRGNTFDFYSTKRGDGTVPWDLGRLTGVPTWYAVGVQHSDLLRHSSLFPGYMDLLKHGKTALLPTSEPDEVRGLAPADGRILMQPDQFSYFNPDIIGQLGGTDKIQQIRTSALSTPPVNVSIRHDNLAFARFPICIGHYKGDTQVGAERQLDSCLGDVLSRQLALDIYPGRLGTWDVFLAPKKETRPSGALVIGLGQVGELTPGLLSATLSRCLLDYALKVAAWQGDDRFGETGSVRHVRISSLLIGTGAGGIPVHSSVVAILMAVKSANEALLKKDLTSQVLITDLEFLELYEDLAIEASKALKTASKDRELSDSFVWEDGVLKSGDAGLQRSFSDDDHAGWWRRMEITHDQKQERLHFVTLTDRARAEHALVSGQLQLAKKFITSMSAQSQTDTKLSRTLYEMLIPNSLKELSPERRDTVLLLDADSASFPWELLDDRWSDNGPLSTSAGLIRQLKTAEYRPKPQQTQDNKAFVVGNPTKDLPGASEEAKTVVRILESRNFTVQHAIEKDQSAIMCGLHADAYRILHLAGHGVHEYELTDDTPPGKCLACDQTTHPQKKRRSGMLIGPNSVLTPGDIEQLRWVPELVFINCCHLGKTQQEHPTTTDYSQLAANLAVQFIRMGVKAVIAAGWAVNDQAASTFAKTFYNAMFNGKAFGYAVLEARKDIHTKFPTDNTWGAYQCYGDPDYRLSQNGFHQERSSQPYVSPSEFEIDLHNLASKARISAVQKDDLEHLLTRIPDKYRDSWVKMANIASTLGIAWAELGHFDQAIASLDTAAKAEESMLTLRTLEQRANYKARHAVTLAKSDTSRSDALFNEAKEELDKLIAIGSSAERHNLLGSYWKRRAIAAQEKFQIALPKMKEHYQTALDLLQGIPEADHFYAKTNVLWADLLLLMTNENSNRSIATIIADSQKLAADAEKKDQDTPSFWTAVEHADALLLEDVASRAINKDKLIRLYTAAIKRGASQREKASVTDHLTFVEQVLKAAPDNKYGGLVQALADIRSALDIA